MKSIHHSLLLEAACFTLYTQTILSYYDRKPPSVTVLCVKLCTSWINAFVQLVQYTFLLPYFSAFPSVFYSDLGSTKSAKLKRLYTLSAINRYFLIPLNLILWDTLAFICTRLSTMFFLCSSSQRPSPPEGKSSSKSWATAAEFIGDRLEISKTSTEGENWLPIFLYHSYNYSQSWH